MAKAPNKKLFGAFYLWLFDFDLIEFFLLLIKIPTYENLVYALYCSCFFDCFFL